MEDQQFRTLENLPKVLILELPPVFVRYEAELSRSFIFMKACDSSLPLSQFLIKANESGVSAMFATGYGPPITGAGILDYVPSLRCIVTDSVGVDCIDLAECHCRGIAVANVGTVSSVSDCVDTAIGLLIDVLRKVSSADRFVRSGVWCTTGEYQFGHRLRGKQIGLVGLGNIGVMLAKRLEAFGCRMLYTSRTKKSNVTYPFYSNVRELAASSDVLVVCCPLSDETRHMINKEVLIALGKDGVLINIARGGVINEQELVRYLVEGRITGAGMDVFEYEPNVPKELFALDNVVLSPHLAAFTEESFLDPYERVKGNLLAFFSNKPLLSAVI